VGSFALAARDAAFALPVREPLPRLGGPAADLLAVAALTPRLDGSTAVAERAAALAGPSGAQQPMVGLPLLSPVNGQRSDRDGVTIRDGSGADENAPASTADFAFAVPVVDAAAEE
jgi:hypothetical protein